MALKSPNKLSIRLTNEELARLMRLAEARGAGTALQPRLSSMVREMALAHPSYAEMNPLADPTHFDRRQLALSLVVNPMTAKAKARKVEAEKAKARAARRSAKAKKRGGR
jgi:hypothetical protein